MCQSLQYFAHSVTHHLPSVKHYYQLGVPQKRTCSAMKPVSMSNINVLYFSIIIVQLYLNTYCANTRQSDGMRDLTAAIAASVVETAHQPVFFH